MYEGLRVKYFLINLKYPVYVKMQAVLIIGWIVGSILFYLFAPTSDIWLLEWLLENSWWLCLVVGGLEVVESLVAISKAKKDYRANSKQI